MNKSWKPVLNRNNSECSTAKLKDLDFTSFYTDRFFAPIYIHAYRKSDDTFHRVFSKDKTVINVGMENGNLFWIVRI